MSYENILFWSWVGTSIPFVVSNIIVICRLILEGQMVQGVYPINEKQLKVTLEELNCHAVKLPCWLCYFLVSQVIVILSVIDGLLWVWKPYRQLKKLGNVLRWNFKEL